MVAVQLSQAADGMSQLQLALVYGSRDALLAADAAGGSRDDIIARSSDHRPKLFFVGGDHYQTPPFWYPAPRLWSTQKNVNHFFFDCFMLFFGGLDHFSKI